MNHSQELQWIDYLGYIFLGGLTSAIYNEVLQFFLIVAGFAPLVFLGLKKVDGWSGLRANGIDLWWGVVLVIFGLFMAFAARKSQTGTQQAREAGPRQRQSPSNSANP